VNPPHWLYNCCRQTVATQVRGSAVSALKLPVKPADKIALCYISNKQVEAVGRLVQPAVAQIVPW
jgi:hypothetical protein